jgi:hypothetical protein
MGSPAAALRSLNLAVRRRASGRGPAKALCQLFDTHFAAACGLSFLEHLHFGEIVPGITPEAVDSAARRSAGW